ARAVRGVRRLPVGRRAARSAGAGDVRVRASELVAPRRRRACPASRTLPGAAARAARAAGDAAVVVRRSRDERRHSYAHAVRHVHNAARRKRSLPALRRYDDVHDGPCAWFVAGPPRHGGGPQELFPGCCTGREQCPGAGALVRGAAPARGGRSMNRYVCVRGHVYQPPRETAWLEAIELQDSAYPYHDWNERVTAECYAP